MTDEREAKLPKWAQEILAAERRMSALAWPTEARPTPLWEPGTNVYAPIDLNDKFVWRANVGFSKPEKAFVFDRYVRSSLDAKHGSRPEHGRFFATEREAWLDIWWIKATSAADNLYAARLGFLNSTGETQ